MLRLWQPASPSKERSYPSSRCALRVSHRFHLNPLTERPCVSAVGVATGEPPPAPAPPSPHSVGPDSGCFKARAGRGKVARAGRRCSRRARIAPPPGMNGGRCRTAKVAVGAVQLPQSCVWRSIAVDRVLRAAYQFIDDRGKAASRWGARRIKGSFRFLRCCFAWTPHQQQSLLLFLQ